jgi:hypothetical protein
MKYPIEPNTNQYTLYLFCLNFFSNPMLLLFSWSNDQDLLVNLGQPAQRPRFDYLLGESFDDFLC